MNVSVNAPGQQLTAPALAGRWPLAKLYMSLIMVAGAAACLLSAYRLPLDRLDARFLILSFITVFIGSRIAVQIPRITGQITVADTFVFLTMLLFDGGAAVLLSAVEGACSSLRISRKPATIGFNVGVLASATFVTVSVMRLIFGSEVHVLSGPSPVNFLLAIWTMAIVQYLANSVLVAIAQALKTEQTIWQTWRKFYLWSSVTYLAGALAAGGAAKLVGGAGFYTVIITTPIVAIVYLTYQTYLKNVEASAQQAEQAERHVEELSRYIREREQAEEALRASEEKYRLLVENIPDVVWSADQTGRCLYISQNIEKINGSAPEDVYRAGRRRWLASIHPDDRQMVEDAYHALFEEHKVFDVEYRLQAADGNWLWLHDKAVDTYERAGVKYADGTLSDITERRTLENQLRQAQKLESIGQLAAGIAHEINTPAQYTGDNIRFLRDGFEAYAETFGEFARLLEAARSGAAVAPELIAEIERAIDRADIEYLSEEMPKAFTQSLEGVDRISKIVQSMKDFAHPGSSEKRSTDINKAIESTITVAANEWKYVAEVETDFDASLPLVPCLLGEFNQVILNLVINATHAIAEVVGDGSGGKGRITVRTEREGSWAVIRVSDTGCGIPEANQPKIFDPFFTTKEVGKGTGQGLAIAHSVIEKHEGQISVESEVGRGTTFTIRLPLNEAKAERMVA